MTCSWFIVIALLSWTKCFLYFFFPNDLNILIFNSLSNKSNIFTSSETNFSTYWVHVLSSVMISYFTILEFIKCSWILLLSSFVLFLPWFYGIQWFGRNFYVVSWFSVSDPMWMHFVIGLRQVAWFSTQTPAARWRISSLCSQKSQWLPVLCLMQDISARSLDSDLSRA